jgi:hypothetical protein
MAYRYSNCIFGPRRKKPDIFAGTITGLANWLSFKHFKEKAILLYRLDDFSKQD